MIVCASKLVIAFAWILGGWTQAQGLASRTDTGSSSDDDGSQAVLIPPSQYFEGVDGPWSTFNLWVGSPEQQLRVTISTSSPRKYVVLSEYGCSTAVFTTATVPTDCDTSRGGLFDVSASSSWTATGDYHVDVEESLGYAVNASFARDSISIGSADIVLQNQTLCGIAYPTPFYMGVFGLNHQSTILPSVGNLSTPSFLTTMKDQNHIPSLSWSYTAGAKYRLKEVYGQLILSGYDTSRFEQNNATFTMAPGVSRDLVVFLQSITYEGLISGTALSIPIEISIDSTDPNFWLPDTVCTYFEEAFGLVHDNQSGLYLVNETQHNLLLNSSIWITFMLSNTESGGDTVSITLPYDAFALQAQYPLVEETSYYFPLRRAANSTQYTLGRAFLQEAYLSVDYERQTFNLSACTWVEGAAENIITIPPRNASDQQQPPSNSQQSDEHTNNHLSTAKIVGITIGSLALLCLGIWVTKPVCKYCYHMKTSQSLWQHRATRNGTIGGIFSKPELAVDGSQIQKTEVSELDSTMTSNLAELHVEERTHELCNGFKPPELAGQST
ncbi:aspartic peptidase domain-containing protein [Xylariaceae sp. FL1019]|nr:aspartic peptidase domain-containing protein [Xylariaceae sp. FL1019]